MQLSNNIIYNRVDSNINVAVSFINPIYRNDRPLSTYSTGLDQKDTSVYVEIPTCNRFALSIGLVLNGTALERDIWFSFEGKYGQSDIKFHSSIVRYKSTQVVLGCQPGNHSTFVYYVPTDRERKEAPSEYPNRVELAITAWEREPLTESGPDTIALLQSQCTSFSGDLEKTPSLLVTECSGSWTQLGMSSFDITLRDEPRTPEKQLILNVEYLTKHRNQMYNMVKKLKKNRSDLLQQLHRIDTAVCEIEENRDTYRQQRDILRDELRNHILNQLGTDDFSFPNQYLTHLCESTVQEK
jgi:hypothetical protein